MLVLGYRRVAEKESHHATIIITWIVHGLVLEDDVLFHPRSIYDDFRLFVLRGVLLSDVAVCFGFFHSVADFQRNSVTAIV